MNNIKNNSSLLPANELSLPFKKLVLEETEEDHLEFHYESAPVNGLEFLEEAGPTALFSDDITATASDLIIPLSNNGADFGNNVTIKKNT